MSGVYESLRDPDNLEAPQEEENAPLAIPPKQRGLKKRRPYGIFCCGGLSGCIAAIAICAIVFGSVSYVYFKYLKTPDPDTTPAGKGQVKEPVTGKVFDIHATFGDQDHTLLGYGVRQKKSGITINVYAVGFYVQTEKARAALLSYKEKSADQLAKDESYYNVLSDNASISREVRIIMTTNLVNKAKMQNGLKEALTPAIQNRLSKDSNSKDQKAEAEAKSHKFASLFSSDPKIDYVYDFHCDEKSILHPIIRKKPQPDMDDEPICRGLTDIYVGANPVSPSLRLSIADGLGRLYDEGENSDVLDPTSDVVFKEKLRITPQGKETQELKLGGSSTYYMFKVPHTSLERLYVSVGAYSDWKTAQSQLNDKWSSISPSELGNKEDFRQDFVSGTFARAVVLKFLRDYKMDEFEKHYGAMEKSMKVHSLSDDVISQVMKTYKDTLNKANIETFREGDSITYFCDVNNSLTLSVACTDGQLKETVNFADPYGCAATLDSFIGKESFFPLEKGIYRVSWGDLFREAEWNWPPQEVENNGVTTSFPMVYQDKWGVSTQLVGALPSTTSFWRYGHRYSAVALYLEAAKAVQQFSDLKGMTQDDCTDQNRKKIMSGKLDRSLHFAKIKTTMIGTISTSDLLKKDKIQLSLKNAYGDDKSGLEAANAAINPVLEWDVRSEKQDGERLIIQCNASNEMKALWYKNGAVKKEHESTIPAVCLAVLEANLIDNRDVPAPGFPVPDDFNAMFTMD